MSSAALHVSIHSMCKWGPPIPCGHTSSSSADRLPGSHRKRSPTWPKMGHQAPPSRGPLGPPKKYATNPLKKWISGPPKKRSTGPEKSRSVGQVCRSHFWHRKTGPFRLAIYCFKLRTPRVPVLRSHFWHRGVGQKDLQKVGQKDPQKVSQRFLFSGAFLSSRKSYLRGGLRRGTWACKSGGS